MAIPVPAPPASSVAAGSLHQPAATTLEQIFAPSLLLKTAATIRKEVRLIRARDVVDSLDWFLSVDNSIKRLSREIISGAYCPSSPTRYELGKSKGSFRVITSMNIKDAIVFRHIADEALKRAIPHKVAGAFFSRRHSTTPVGKTLTIAPDPYHSFFEIWLKYHQYRTHTMLHGIYNVLVISDITNFFDSIQHDLLIEYLSPLQLPRKLVGLLGRILEALKPLSGHSPNPRVGLPTDELDCSRELAHLFLFEHDHQVTKEFGEDNYVRWLDDQNIGVKSQSEGRRAVNLLTRSLAAQRLTLNSSKTKLLQTSEIAIHFQLDANQQIDNWESKFKSISLSNLSQAQAEFTTLWSDLSSSPHAGKGNWAKILKRLYGNAIKSDSALFEHIALEHLIENPDLDERIFLYFAKRNQGSKLLTMFEQYCSSGENLFEGTESVFWESTLLLDPTTAEERALRTLARQFALGQFHGQVTRPLGRASAIVSLYWLGEKASVLESLFDAATIREAPKEVARAWLAVAFAVKKNALRSIHPRIVGHPADDVSRLSDLLVAIADGSTDSLGAYKHQRSRWPQAGKYYDARSWLALDIASWSPNAKLRAQLKKDFGPFKQLARTVCEKRVYVRVAKKLP